MEGITSPPMSSSSSNSIFSPLFISMMGIVTTSIAIILYHFFLVKYCTRRRPQNPMNPTTAQHAPPTTIGVDQKLLQSIPISPFSSLTTTKAHIQDECAVCLGELEDQDMVRMLPYCKHAFHVACIDEWLASHTTCPLCRAPVVHADDENPPRPPPCSGSNGGGESSGRSSDASNTTDGGSRGGGGGGGGESSSSSSSSESGGQPFGLLHHCASTVLQPVESRASCMMINGLKRSMSMDQCVMAINIERESESTRGGGSYRTRSMGHFDRVSSKLLRSFSRLRMGNGNSATILPY